MSYISNGMFILPAPFPSASTLRRMNEEAIRACPKLLTITVRPASPSPATYPDPPASSAPIFQPFTIRMLDEERAGDLVTRCSQQPQLPELPVDGTAKYEFVVGPGPMKVTERSNGPISAFNPRGSEKMEVRVAVVGVRSKEERSGERHTILWRAFWSMGMK